MSRSGADEASGADDGRDSLRAPEMKTKAERGRTEGSRERGEILQIPTVTEGDGAGNGATRRRPGELPGRALSAVPERERERETEGDFQLRLFRSNPLSFSDGRREGGRDRRPRRRRQNLLRQMEDQRGKSRGRRVREDEKKFAKMDGKKELREETERGRASLSLPLSSQSSVCLLCLHFAIPFTCAARSLARSLVVCVPETWRIHLR